MTLSSEIQAVHVETGEQTDEIQSRWDKFVQAPALEAGLPAPPLAIIKSPYRFVVNPIADYVMELEKKNPDHTIAVIIPELVEHHWYQFVLHNQRPKWLKALLLLKDCSRVVLVTVPWRLGP